MSPLTINVACVTLAVPTGGPDFDRLCDLLLCKFPLPSNGARSSLGPPLD